MSQSFLTIRDSVFTSFTEALNHFMGFVPALCGALLVLSFGWIMTHFLAKAVDRMLTKFGFEKAVRKSGLYTFIHQSGTKLSACQVIGELTKWFFRLIFIQAAASILSMPQVTQVISSIILFIPKVIVALVILVAGSLISRFLATAVRGSASKVGSNNPEFLATLTHYAVTGFSVIAAVSQLEIAPNIVNILFTALVSSVALAIGLSFGLGGRDVAAEITRRWYDGSQKKTPADRIRKAG
jgi:hypothetical protein